MTGEPFDGPLPDLESDNPQWVAARRREWAAGERAPERGKPRAAASMLREWLSESALVDVYCHDGGRQRLVLRVADDEGRPMVRYDVRVLDGGHQSSWLYALTDAPVFGVPCRCGATHALSALALARQARGVTAGKPRRCRVSHVAAGGNR